MHNSDQSEHVNIRARIWPLLVMCAVIPGFLLTLLALLPAQERGIDTAHYLLVVAGLTAAFVALAYSEWWRFGRESLSAGRAGLTTTSRRHGNLNVCWADVEELGALPSIYLVQLGGLAARLRPQAKEQEDPGRARLICQPTGGISFKKQRLLQQLAEEAGVPWRSYQRIDLARPVFRRGKR